MQYLFNNLRQRNTASPPHAYQAPQLSPTNPDTTQGTNKINTHSEILQGDGVISIYNKLLRRQRYGLLEFGRQIHAHGTKELKLGSGDGDNGEESVHVVHCKGKDFLFATLFFANL